MSKNIKNKVIAGVVGFGIVLTPTVAFADSAVVGTTTTVVAPATTPAPVSTSKPTDANKATHKAAVEAYRVAPVASGPRITEVGTDFPAGETPPIFDLARRNDSWHVRGDARHGQHGEICEVARASPGGGCGVRG